MPGLGNREPSPWPTSLVTFVYPNVARLLKDAQMAGEVSLTEIQRVLKGVELGSADLGENRQDAEPSSLVDHLIERHHWMSHEAPVTGERLWEAR
jgi:hypothetical protein